jgi:hypothetical protein
MARRPSLSEASVTRPSRMPLPPTPISAADAKRSPARQGKKAVAFWGDPAMSTQLRLASVHTNRGVQDLMTEALEDLLLKLRLSREAT